MKKGYIWLACILFWSIIVGLICCGARQLEEPAQEKETIRKISVELLTMDKHQQIGVQHMAGINTDLIWSLPDVDEPELVSLGEFTITAYCACERCCGKSPDDPGQEETGKNKNITQKGNDTVSPNADAGV